MKRGVVYSLCLALLGLLACTTKRNAFVNRAYHNLTARFNGYYYSSESIREGVFKVERSHKDDYTKTLPVFVYPTNETAKSNAAEFDRAIKKSSTCIQRHTIKDKKGQEIAKAGKWIDNNWINIGKSHFYKREFFSGIEAFDYVVRTYQSKDKYTALLWLAKSYNEIGSVSQSEPIISLLKNEKKLPSSIRKQLYTVEADYHIQRGLYTEAMTDLSYAIRQSGWVGGIKKSNRARYAFITAQLAELQKDERKARKFYERTIKMKPGYEMSLNAKIKLARISDVRSPNIGKIKRELLAMTREEKNAEYLDLIYYTLGEISEKEKAIYQALAYYQRSVKGSVNNPTQKARSFLKLGEINFDLTNYALAGAYYDSTVTALPKDHPEYEQIVARKKTLQKLVSHITTIKLEDSLQRMAKLSDGELDKIMDRIIQQKEEEERQAQEALERAQSNNTLNGANTLGNAGRAIDIPVEKGAWYFYNPTAVSFGVAEFQRKWGTRKQEDNWRRSSKALTIEDPNAVSSGTNTAANTNANDGVAASTAFKKQYKTQLPTNDSTLKISNAKIIEAYYALGSIYKEDLHNSKKSIEAFEELNTRFATHKYQLSSYYQLYRICSADRKQEKADLYKEKILTEYANSEYAKLILNPKYAEELNVNKSEVEKNYSEVYQVYAAKNYNEAYLQASAAISKYGKTDFTPKYEFIKALCIGKLKTVDSLEQALKQLVAMYPRSEVTPKANDILQAIKKQKNPELFNLPKPNNANNAAIDTFKVSLDTEHLIVIVSPDDPNLANDLKNRIDQFNRDYYSNKQFSITSSLFGEDKQMIVVKSFLTATEAHTYLLALHTDTKYIKGEFKKLDVPVLNISSANLPLLYKKRNVKGYSRFYDENYVPEFSTLKKPN